ncbi:MAG: hypothetical protein H0T51_11225 [Pirellulales bacterium]|nr:hypothetical protein [Pirellulales bacterium]
MRLGATQLHAVLKQPLLYLWALPWSALGLAAGAFGLASGGRVRRCGGAIEFYGGGVPAMLALMPGGGCTIAMTLGHVILGRTTAALDLACEHERVHVRQYERWGPLFIPAYLLCSAFIWTRGGDAYRDNPFEREAYRIAP